MAHSALPWEESASQPPFGREKSVLPATWHPDKACPSSCETPIPSRGASHHLPPTRLVGQLRADQPDVDAGSLPTPKTLTEQDCVIPFPSENLRLHGFINDPDKFALQTVEGDDAANEQVNYVVDGPDPLILERWRFWR